MKKRSILLSGLFALTMCLAGCSDDDEQPDPLLPPLVWPDDVATAIPDERFRKYCLGRYDKNGDGRLSKDEVLAVTSMIYDALGNRSFEGIEYFGNLEKLDWGYCDDVPILDLRYNTRLKRVRLEWFTDLVVFRGPVGYSPLTIEFLNPCRKLQTFDLSGCANVRELLISARVPADGISATIDLPDLSHLQYLTIAAVDAGCYDALLAGAVNLKRLYCDFYPDAVLDLSHCPKLEVLSVQTFAGSSLSKIRLRKEAPLDMQFEIRNEKGEDCRHLIEIEYVQ